MSFKILIADDITAVRMDCCWSGFQFTRSTVGHKGLSEGRTMQLQWAGCQVLPSPPFPLSLSIHERLLPRRNFQEW